MSDPLGLFTAEEEVECRFDGDGFRFFLEKSLFNEKVKANFKFESIDFPIVKDFKVHAELKEDFSSFVLNSLENLFLDTGKSLTDALAKVDKIKKEIDEARAKRKKTSNVAKKAYLTGKIATLWTAHKAATTALKAARKLATSKLGKTVIKVGGKVPGTIFKVLGKGFKITRAAIDFSLKEYLFEGKFPAITFDAIVLGKEIKNKKIQLDILTPAEIIKKVYKKVKKLVAKNHSVSLTPNVLYAASTMYDEEI